MTARFSLMVLVGVCFAIPGLVFGCGRDAASEGAFDMSENALSGAYFQEGSDGLTSMETEHNDGVTSANGHSWTLSAEAEASNGAAMTAGPNIHPPHRLRVIGGGGGPIVDSGAPPPVTTSPSGSVDEFVGPFPSWANVKTMYNAKGDGITDDTAALQAALNAVGTAGNSDVIYLPAGMYKITATLKQTAKKYVSFLGQDPATTKIRWAGPAGGWMFWANGVKYSRWGRITWDGANTAGIGVAHKWDKLNVPGYNATVIEHSDEVFQDMKRGIVGGDQGSNYGWNDDTVSIIRSKFIRNSEAGVSVESYNALNYWIWDSEFTDNARGATSAFCCGNFFVYRSVFRNSSIADIHIRATSHYSFRGNTSIGSNRFLLADFIGQNPAAITVQDNKILDTVQANAISDNNVGTLFLIDNVIRSKSGASGPAVTMDTGWATGPDVVSVGNTFTVAAPISVKGERALVGPRRSSRSLRQHRRHHSEASRHAPQQEQDGIRDSAGRKFCWNSASH